MVDRGINQKIGLKTASMHVEHTFDSTNGLIVWWINSVSFMHREMMCKFGGKMN